MNETFDDLINAANENKMFNVNFDPTDCECVKCDNCGSIMFTPVVVIRRVEGIKLGLGEKNQLYPEQGLCCAKCGTMFKKDRIYFGLEKDDEQKNANDGGLII